MCVCEMHAQHAKVKCFSPCDAAIMHGYSYRVFGAEETAVLDLSTFQPFGKLFAGLGSKQCNAGVFSSGAFPSSTLASASFTSGICLSSRIRRTEDHKRCQEMQKSKMLKLCEVSYKVCSTIRACPGLCKTLRQGLYLSHGYG